MIQSKITYILQATFRQENISFFNHSHQFSYRPNKFVVSHLTPGVALPVTNFQICLSEKLSTIASWRGVSVTVSYLFLCAGIRVDMLPHQQINFVHLYAEINKTLFITTRSWRSPTFLAGSSQKKRVRIETLVSGRISSLFEICSVKKVK